MIVAGLTGNIATGKTTVSRMFRKFGASIVDADQVARKVVEPGKPAWQRIVDEFGEDILLEDSRIDRKKLGDIVFSNSSKREKLNSITHPEITKEIRRQVEELRKGGCKVVIIEAALIVEKGGMKGLLDTLIVVASDEALQIDRLRSRDNLGMKEAKMRIDSQMPLKEKLEHADFVIYNDGDMESTENQVEKIWFELLESAGE